MSFRFKEKDKIVKYFETEMGLNNVKINKIIKDIEEIENNKITNNDNECSICEEERIKLNKCKYCTAIICSSCYEICNECRNRICHNCLSTYCPICYDICDLCNQHEKN